MNSIWDNLSIVIFDNSLYRFFDKWPAMNNICFKIGYLFLMLATIPEFFTAALSSVRMHFPLVRVTKLEKVVIDLTRPIPLPILTTCYWNGFVPFSTAE